MNLISLVFSGANIVWNSKEIYSAVADNDQSLSQKICIIASIGLSVLALSGVSFIALTKTKVFVRLDRPTTHPILRKEYSHLKLEWAFNITTLTQAAMTGTLVSGISNIAAPLFLQIKEGRHTLGNIAIARIMVDSMILYFQLQALQRIRTPEVPSLAALLKMTHA